MNTSCKLCSKSFQIENDDIAFYKKLDVPTPIYCPSCREMFRMSWCNEGVLYIRNCDLCNRRSISQYSTNNPLKSYCYSCWWGDKWDAMNYGIELDLTQSFFAQFTKLLNSTPHCHTHTDLSSENSEYTHHAGHQKNCYMMFHCSFAENCYYGYGVKKALSCVDTHYCHESELCYECIDVNSCYDLAWSQDCTNSSNSRFLFDCIGCKNCFLCTNLRNKEYYFLNKKLSKSQYLEQISKLNLGSKKVIQSFIKKFEEIKTSQARRNLRMVMTENCLGNNLLRARESEYCFDCSDIEFSKFCTQLQLGTKYCHDIYQFGINIELCYDCTMIGYNIYNCKFCYDLLEQCNNLEYCVSCHSTKDSFGCFGLKRKQYCILNRQYNKEDYYTLRDKIIKAMKDRAEHGRPLLPSLSPHGYNETSANFWFPKSKQEIESLGWNWEDNLPFSTGKSTVSSLPDDVSKIGAEILSEIIKCSNCSRDYKFIEKELEFYQTQGFPAPTECFQCRRTRRMAKREPRKFYMRNCDSCAVDIPSTISSSRVEKVLCEKCYLENTDRPGA